MSRRLFAVCIAAPLFLVGTGACGSNSSKGGTGDTSDATHIAVKISDEGCDPASIDAKAGKIAFDVTNTGSSSVIEFYVKKGGKLVGEVENVVPGTPKTLTLTLKPGAFTIQCPNGTKNETGTLTVTA